MAVPDDGVDEPLSVAEILRREGISVPHSSGSALVARRHQRALITPPPDPAVSRKALAVTGSLLVVGAVFGASVLDEAMTGPGLGAEPVHGIAAAGPGGSAAIPAQRGAPITSVIGLAAMSGPDTLARTVPDPAMWTRPGAPGQPALVTPGPAGPTPGGPIPGGPIPGGTTPGGTTPGGGAPGGGATPGGGGGLPVGIPSVPVEVPPVQTPPVTVGAPPVSLPGGGGTTPVGVTLPGVGVGGGSTPTVSTSPAKITTPAVTTPGIDAGPVAVAPASAKLPDVGVSGATVDAGKGQATLPAVTVSPAEVKLPAASVAGIPVDPPKVATPAVQVPATSLIVSDPVKTVQSVGRTATGVLGSLTGGH